VDLEREYVRPLEKSTSKIECSDQGVWKLFPGVTAVNIQHRIPSFAFIFQEKDQPGSIDAAKLEKMGIKPGPIYGKLKKGENVEFMDQTLNPQDFLGPSKLGRKIVILGDTHDTSDLVSKAQGADLVIHEATMENSLRDKCVEYGHSTPDMAAKFALDAKASTLILTHVSPRYMPFHQQESETEPKSEKKERKETAEILLNEARTFLENNSGNQQVPQVFVAHDFFKFNLTRKFKSCW